MFQRYYRTSYKSKSSSWLVLGSKATGFADVFNIACTIKRDKEQLIKFSILISMVSDISTLFDVFTKSIIAREKRFVIDFQTVKEENQ